MSSSHDNDREIEEFLAQSRSPLVDLYHKLPQPQPDAPLDQRVLQLARQALADDAAALSHPAKKPTRRYKPSRWPIAFGSAASVVFAATLALHFGKETWQAQDHAPAGAAATSANDVIHVRSIDLPAAKSVVSDSVPAPMQPAASAMSTAKPEAADAAAMNSATYAHKKTQSVSQTAPAAAAPTLALENPDSDKAAKPKLEAAEITSSNVRRADAENASPVATLGSEHEAARQRATLAAPGRENQTRDERDAVERKLDIATGRDAAMRARNNADATRPQVAGAMQQSSPPVAAAPAPAVGRTAPMQAGGAASAIANNAASPTAAAPASIIGPDAWIANIRAQLLAGKSDDAVRNLKLFHEKYPNYELTPDLRQLLP
ncbi:hypothetical protein ELE36_09445 [Pseudolysobacter antarcticus]|uniref:Uncharacterized protein n=1 Tax=Pseudolysobacter antarcticus TaxID=2511995 RepID=A0A411HJA6_9GAMM|nr:hypothetical protein [Pseudolysobacter antarcticus]QBB70571.1 hypothetical protein ELE36_09445 [Pseudolysobacter antarcticus]